MELQKLYDMANEYCNFSCTPSNKKYKAGEIIDEEKSVRWNREEVERRNNLRIEEVKRLGLERQLLFKNFNESVRQYIVERAGVSSDNAERIYNYVHNLGDSLKDMLDLLDELLYLFNY